MDIRSVLCKYHGDYQKHQYAAQWIFSFGHCFLRRMSASSVHHLFLQHMEALDRAIRGV